MNEQTIIQTILASVVERLDYERMVALDCSNMDGAMTYEDFLEWNRICIDKMNNGDRLWTLGLCQRINGNKLRLMDLESCATFTACSIYFGQDSKLCIINGR